MKYLLLLLSFFIFWLAGCSQKEPPTNESSISDTDTLTSEEIGKKQNLWGDFLSTTQIEWIYFPIFLSNTLLSFSWSFSLKIPQGLKSREYVSNKTPVNDTFVEYLWFANDDNTKSFSIHISKLLSSTYSDKEICNVEYFDWYITKSEKIKIIQNRNIYINYATLMVSAPDIEPFKVLDNQICFVDNDIVYKFSASNFPHTEMDQIINSFTFFN